METTITATSMNEMTNREKLKAMDISFAMPLNDLADGARLDITDYVLLHINNENAKNPEYDILVLITTDGERYTTSSEPFRQSFINKYDMIVGSGEEPFLPIEIGRVKSKNNEGKILLCGLA